MNIENMILMAMLNKDPDETMIDIQEKLMKSGMVNMIESKRVFMIFILEKYIAPQYDQLTVKGFIKAKEVEKEFGS